MRASGRNTSRKTNNRGPKTDPCETPYKRVVNVEHVPAKAAF